jgi:hypothetical protein
MNDITESKSSTLTSEPIIDLPQLTEFVWLPVVDIQNVEISFLTRETASQSPFAVNASLQGKYIRSILQIQANIPPKFRGWTFFHSKMTWQI